jgi:hypothetical protein
MPEKYPYSYNPPSPEQRKHTLEREAFDLRRRAKEMLERAEAAEREAAAIH